MKAFNKEHHFEDLDVLCNLYLSDFDKEQIRVQLHLQGDSFDVVPVVTANGAMNIFHKGEHAENEHWRLVEDRYGQVGYAPAAFLVVILDTTAEEEESDATKKGQERTTRLGEA